MASHLVTARQRCARIADCAHPGQANQKLPGPRIAWNGAAWMIVTAANRSARCKQNRLVTKSGIFQKLLGIFGRESAKNPELADVVDTAAEQFGWLVSDACRPIGQSGDLSQTPAR